MSVNCKVVNTPGVTIGDGTGIVTTFVTSNGQTVSLDSYVSKTGDSEIKGNVTATSFVKKDGTSSQFLKADGSSDSIRISVVDINTAFGTDSLISNTDGYNNTAIGECALRNNNVGINNTAIGTSVLRYNSVGINNTGLGLNALLNNTEGNYNTGLGCEADVTSADLTNATAIGYNAKVSSSNTIQLGNTGVNMINTSAEITAASFIKTGGTSSQFLKADGSSDSSRIFVNETNVAIGTDSLISNTSVDNMAFGKEALKNNTTGSYNTAIGSVALLENISGNNNAAIGTGALMKNTTGKHNTGIGVVSLYENLTGDYNLAMGVNTLQNNTTGNGNTSCGVESMMANTTGNNNTALGYKADVDSADLTNATAIGSNAKVTSSNTIQLGDTNVTMVNTSASITAGSFVKSGGLNTQYLMGDGSTLTQSANSGNSNYYTFKTGGTGTSPASGYITWGDFQYAATKVYVSKTTTDGFDITPFVKGLSQLNDLYLQKKSSAGTYIRYNITEVKSDSTSLEFTVVSPPVENSSDFTSSANGFADEDQLLVSFFSNLVEADTRLSSLESVVAVSGGTKTVTATSFVKSGGNSSEFLKADGTVDRIIRGTINANSPFVASGTGFTVDNPSTGKYTITFTGNPFTGLASIVATISGTGAGKTASVDTNSTTSATQTCVISTGVPGTGGSFINSSFSFIAIGT